MSITRELCQPLCRPVAQPIGWRRRSVAVLLASITAPAEQEIVTQGTAYTVSVHAPSDASVEIFDGASKLGDAVSAGGGNWTYAWTPSAADYGVELRAVGNVSGSSATRTVVAAEANRISQVLTSWSKSSASITVTGGQADPDGGTAAYRVDAYTATNTKMSINATASAAPSVLDSGFEIWARPNGMDVLMIYPLEDGGNHYVYIDIVTGQSFGQGARCAIVERRGEWARIWFRFAGAETAGPRTFFVYMCNDLQDNTPNTTAGDGMYLFEPRTADGALPFRPDQDLCISYTSVSGGVEQWEYTHPYIDSIADLFASRRRIDVIKPTGWTAEGNYPVVFALPVTLRTSEDVSAPFISGDYANTYQCVIVIPYDKTGIPWYGAKSDGTYNGGALLSEVLPAFAREHLGCPATRETTLVIGYSKSAFGALSLIMRNPQVFGYACAWDGFWSSYTTPNVNQTPQFDTEAQWNLYNPLIIAAASASGINDKTRIALLGFNAWAAEQTAMAAALDSAGIPYDYDATSRASHSWAAGWLDDGMSRLMTLAGISEPA